MVERDHHRHGGLRHHPNPSIGTTRRTTTLLTATNDDGSDNNSDSKTPTSLTTNDPKSYGFDDPVPTAPPTPQTTAPQATTEEKLRRSLDESAKFKVKNDARFAWLTTLAVSSLYAYGCFGGEEGREVLEIAGIPNGGLVGGIVGVLGAVGSLVLFFAPELFGGRRRR